MGWRRRRAFKKVEFARRLWVARDSSGGDFVSVVPMTTASRYPLFFAGIPQDRHSATERDIEALFAGAAEGATIWHVDFKDAVDWLNRRVSDSYRAACEANPAPYDRNRRTPFPEEEFYWSVNLSNLHDITAAHKKAHATKVEGKFVTMLKKFTAELLPLAEAAKVCRGKAMKGRKPSGAPAKPVNPNKILKTCPCCFRQIAVDDAKIVLHGYRRPGDGATHGRCFGVDYPPLETSTAGLVAYIADRDELARQLAVNIMQCEVETEISVPRPGGSRYERVTLKKGEDGFDAALARRKRDLEWDLSGVRRHIVHLRAELGRWEANATPAV